VENAAISLKNTTTRKTMWLLDVLTDQEYDCRLIITAKRNKAEKSLGGVWF
jgi:hypothetical protein